MRARRGWRRSFVFGSLALLLVLGWVTARVLHLEREQLAASAEARHQESLRLALWRLDAELIPALAREAARPYFEYLPYYPQGRAYTRMLHSLDAGEVLVPSPLLTYRSPWFPLHVQFSPRTGVTSPQVPRADQAELALMTCLPGDEQQQNAAVLERVRAVADFERLWRQVGEAESAPVPAPAVPAGGEPRRQAGVESQVLLAEDGDRQERAAPGDAAAGAPASAAPTAGPGALPAADAIADIDEPLVIRPQTFTAEPPAEVQTAWSNAEFSKRNRGKLNVQSIAAESLRNTLGLDTVAEAPVTVGPLVAVWAGDGPARELLLLRRVVANEERMLQGLLVDWPALRSALLAEIEDLLPGAVLRPTTAETAASQAARTLAMIPVAIETGPVAAIEPGWTTTRGTLVLVWVAVVVAIGAVGTTLRSTVAFAEKRSRFASAVTHELRTPLTTFRMYAEMLADGMVTDPEHRARYLETLRSESDRLGRLVENVLAYARVEDGRASLRPRDIAVAELVERIEPALAARAAESGLELRVDLDGVGGVIVHTDEEAVGQILANLVDNAGKYAADGEPAELRLDASREDGRVRLSLRDHGPGVPPDKAAAIFSAFDRGAVEPGDTRPGLGLGLALSRGLARDLGGDLLLEAVPDGERGARFTLVLPRWT